MKRISINNGRSYVTVGEALKEIDFDAIVNYMDDESREQVNKELAPCTEQEFLTRYLELAENDLIIG